MQFHSGINSKAFAGSATANHELPLIGWSVNPGAEVQNFRNSMTGRFSYKEVTFFDASASITIDWDFSANPFLAANGGLSVTAGATVAARLYISGTSGAYWDFPSAVVVSNPQSDAVDGKPATTINISANGVYVEPAA